MTIAGKALDTQHFRSQLTAPALSNFPGAGKCRLPYAQEGNASWIFHPLQSLCLLVEVMCFLPFRGPWAPGSIQSVSLEKGVKCYTAELTREGGNLQLFWLQSGPAGAVSAGSGLRVVISESPSVVALQDSVSMHQLKANTDLPLR